MTERVNITTARRATLTVATVWLLLGAWQFYRSRPAAAVVLIGLGTFLAFLTILVPTAAVWFHRRWMGLAAVLGYVNTRILLTLVYYLLFTPMGAVLKLVGRDPLTRRASHRSSYWVQRQSVRQSREGFQRGF